MFSDFLSLIFSETCSVCNGDLMRNEKFLCLNCRYNLPKTDFHLNLQNILAKRIWGKMPLCYAFAYLKYTKGGAGQKLLYQIKYKGNRELAKELGLWYGEELMKHHFADKFDLILPVPLHKKKFAKRGFNQSFHFAEGLSEKLNIDLSEKILLRGIHRESQTSKSRFSRWKNVNDVYYIKEDVEVKNKRILLVDDVITTGATIEACGKVLFEAGVSELSCAGLAAAI